MSDPIMVYSSLMRMQIERLNSIAENTSNVNTTGYLQESTQIDPGKFLDLLNGGENTESYNYIKSQGLGSLKITGLSTDIALASDHWFVVNFGEEQVVTRNGNFSLSSDGILQFKDKTVQGENGPIQGLTQNFRVHADGRIYVDDADVGKLQIVGLSNGSQLQSVGDSMYRVDGAFEVADTPRVVQGALTSSNVKLEEDMTRMIEITRHIESIQRAISSYDDLLNAGINQLGNGN